MRLLPTLLTAVVLALAGGGQALACRVGHRPLDPANRPYDAIVLVTVRSAAYGEQLGERPSWKATGRLRQTVLGDPGSATFEFGRTGSSAACDDGLPIPALGEVWVLYMSRHPQSGTLFVNRSAPLRLIGPVDPRLKDLQALRERP